MPVQVLDFFIEVLTVALDFSGVTGLANNDNTSTLVMADQDGFTAGTLQDFDIEDDGPVLLRRGHLRQVYTSLGVVTGGEGIKPLVIRITVIQVTVHHDLPRDFHAVAIERRDELSDLLAPFVRSGRPRVIRASAPEQVKKRSRATRRSYRCGRFRAYFEHARELRFSLDKVGILRPRPDPAGRIASLGHCAC